MPDVKIAVMNLYNHNLLSLEQILNCVGFLKSTFWHTLKLWRETGDIINPPIGLSGWPCARHLDDVNYLIQLINHSPTWFLNKLLDLLMSIHVDSKSNWPDSLEAPAHAFFKGHPLFFGMVGGTGSLAASGWAEVSSEMTSELVKTAILLAALFAGPESSWSWWSLSKKLLVKMKVFICAIVSSRGMYHR